MEEQIVKRMLHQQYFMRMWSCPTSSGWLWYQNMMSQHIWQVSTGWNVDSYVHSWYTGNHTLFI